MSVPYRIIIEEQEYELYGQVIDKSKLLVLDRQYQRDYDTFDNLGDTKGKGPGAARNFAWDHAVSLGASWHWVMDDNIRHFFRLHNNQKVIFSDETVFRCMEDFCQRYRNVAMAGPNYHMFAPRKRKIPALVLNTRIYSCVAPATPILCADLVWRPAGSLVPGQRIVAFDSEANPGGRGRNVREFRTATVERNEPSSRPSSVVTTDRGIPVQASDDHPWLVYRRISSNARPYKGGPSHGRCALAWVATNELRIGDRIAHLARPWTRDETHEGGWVAGIYDGEGCCTVRRDTYGIQLAIAQKPGLVMERLKAALGARGYTFAITHHKSGCDCLRLGGGFLGAIQFAGEFAPTRLIAKAVELWEHRGVRLGQSYEWATVTAVESVGVQPIAQITTSTGTFITGGYYTHNCNLIRNDVPFRWRGRYNEDTDLSLRMLKAGWATVQFNAFLQGKVGTQLMKGGNTAEFYNHEGTLAKSKMQVAMHPDCSRMMWRFGRVHHFVDYRRFKNNPLLPRPGLVIPSEADDYGLSIVKIAARAQGGTR